MITVGAVCAYLVLIILYDYLPTWITWALMIGFTYGLIFWT